VIGPRSTSLLHRLDQFDLIPGIVGDLRVVVVPGSRARLVCIGHTREVDVILPARLATVSLERSISIIGAMRTLKLGALSPRVVVIPPEETCCE
jgi:hypothetical protein